ncbi:MAG: hypothetical protein V1877_02390, partial [Candidatus Tagabacteria bacterium]
SGDTFYAGELIGYFTPDYASDYPTIYSIPPIERYSFSNFGSSTPSGFDGKVALTASSFPLNPNRYYKFSINGGDASRAFQVYGSASDTYSNGKTYYSSSYSYPCVSPLFNPEEACELGTNNSIADMFFSIGTAETLSGTETAVTTEITRQEGAVIDGDIIAWKDNDYINLNDTRPNDIYIYEISTGRKIRVTNDGTMKNTLMLADRKILWTVQDASSQNAIFIHDLDTGITTEITTEFTKEIGVRAISISDFDGQRIAWQTDYEGSVPSIYIYDLATSRSILIDRGAFVNSTSQVVSNPKISGNKILYKWFWNCGTWCGQEELRLYDIATGEKTKILNNYGFSSDYAIDGDNIIITPQLYRYKISTGETTPISSSFRQITGIDISGDIVVWSDTYDIFMYDLATGKTGRAGMAPGASFSPKVSGNIVVWDDYRAVTNESSNIDVYMYQLVSQNNPPTLSNLLQWDGSTVISEGYVVRHPLIAFSANVSDTDGDQIQLQVELRRFEEPFTGNYDGGILTSDFVPSGWTNIRVTRLGLSDGKYHWRARAIDSSGNKSEWQEFGVAGSVDFEILTNQLPIASFTFQPSSPKVGDEILFDASGSYDPDGTIILYGWDWNTDGAIDIYSNTPSIQYGGLPAGTATTTLHVIDDKGGVGINTVFIPVEPNNPPTGNNEHAGTASISVAFCSAFGGWWCGAEAYQNEQDIKKIDEWLRDKDGDDIADENLKPFYWLRGTGCAGAGTAAKKEECLISALNTQFKDGSGHDSGLTYKTYSLSVIDEQRMVEGALKRLTPGVYPYKAFLSALLKWLPFSNVGSALYNDVTSKGVENFLIESVPIIGNLPVNLFTFGSSAISLALNAKKINETFNDINDETYLLALGGYFRLRLFGSDPHAAWMQLCNYEFNNDDWPWWIRFFALTDTTECGAKILLKPQMSQKMLDETEIKFEEWYKKYNIENFPNAELLDNTFKQGLKDNIETLIKYSIKNKKNK